MIKKTIHLNILLVNQQGNATVSGVASHFENITRTLLALGHTVERLIAENKKGYGQNSLIKSHPFKYISTVADTSPKGRRKRILQNRVYFATALKKVAWKNIDLVITSNDIRIPLLTKYFDRKKIITVIPSSLAFSPICNPKGYAKVVRRMKKNLAGVHAVVLSGKMKNMLAKLLHNKQAVSVVSPGVDLKKFLNIPAKKKSSEVLYVGRIAEEKNIPALIEAMAKIKNSGHLTIVGGGSEMDKIKKLAKQQLPGKKVTFMGRKTQVAKYYATARVFVLPSQYEAFGLVILEAMAAGLPVIAFKPSRTILTASDEIISNGVNGYLVKDTTEMAQKIDLLLKNDKLHAKMSKHALLKARANTWGDHVNNLLRLARP